MDHLPNPAARDAAIKRYPYALSDTAFATLGALADFLVIIAASVLSSAAYHWAFYGSYGLLYDYLTTGLLAALIYVPLQIMRKSYLVNTLLTEGRRVETMFYGWNYVFLALLIIGFLTKETAIYSRGAMAFFYITGFAALLPVREAFHHLARNGFRKGLLLGKPAMLLGNPAGLKKFHDRYNPNEFGLRIVDEIVITRHGGLSRGAARIDHQLKACARRARALGVEDIFILSSWSHGEFIRKALERFLEIPVSVHLGPDEVLDHFRDARLQRLGPITSLELARPPLSVWARLAKRTLDITGAGIGLVVTSPILLFAAIAIKLDSPGPVFFMQTRRGFNHEPFRIFKFRTMHVLEENAAVRQATRDDPRITRVGRLLRRWSIDELPQLLNVLKGDMSLVGPRPHAMNHDTIFEKKVRLYARRHNVLPGITGWAQVNGYRGETDTDEKIIKRVEYDLEYIDRWSIWFDLYIIALTIFSPRTWRNAY